MRRIASMLAMVALAIGLGVGFGSPAMASTLHGCPDTDVCVYKNVNFGTPMAPRTAGSIAYAPGHCWLFNSDWINQTTSYAVNYTSTDGSTVRFYDGSSCTGSYFSVGSAHTSAANVPDGWNDRINSIWVSP